MQSQIAEAIALKLGPVAVLFTDEKPAAALQFKEGGWGCTAAMMLAAAKGRVAAFIRQTSGCPGGGTGLGRARMRGSKSRSGRKGRQGQAEAGNLRQKPERAQGLPEWEQGWVASGFPQKRDLVIGSLSA